MQLVTPVRPSWPPISDPSSPPWGLAQKLLQGQGWLFKHLPYDSYAVRQTVPTRNTKPYTQHNKTVPTRQHHHTHNTTRPCPQETQNHTRNTTRPYPQDNTTIPTTQHDHTNNTTRPYQQHNTTVPTRNTNPSLYKDHLPILPKPLKSEALPRCKPECLTLKRILQTPWPSEVWSSRAQASEAFASPTSAQLQLLSQFMALWSCLPDLRGKTHKSSHLNAK